MADGFRQRPVYDYHECSALLVDLHLVHLLLSVSVDNHIDTSHVDVKTAFLETTLGEDIWLSVPAELRRDTAAL